MCLSSHTEHIPRFVDVIRVHGDPPPPQPASLEVATSSGPRMVHVDPASYVARPFDLVTEQWVSHASIRRVDLYPRNVPGLIYVTIRYIRKFLNYVNDDGCWFPVHRVPTTGAWAVVDENPDIMHRVYRGRPLLAWIIGVAHDVYLGSPREGATPTLQVTCDLLRDADRVQLIAIHDATSSQPMQPGTRFTFRSPSSEEEGTLSHNSVYDARQQFARRSAMRDISPGRILAGDIILVECTIVCTEGGANVRTLSFVIDSLHWLVEKPRLASVETQRVEQFPDVISLDQ
ncbi:hypothetical protein K466DRAFT_606254 [Polyporus arcularius HHB13444]|uniref:Uncharacterized protein n=1 Tax=Polyporus arcularius HHB13444 TaxID=1314778 RepID=A0A5C3NPS4_9APHY|nr:hypothetical protein K466DRAFT_606254 [Polyporus arcularius HHB13444]